MSQVARNGNKPVSSPALEAELAHRRRARPTVPTAADAPQRVSTLPPHRPPTVHEGQLTLASGERPDGAGSDE